MGVSDEMGVLLKVIASGVEAEAATGIISGKNVGCDCGSSAPAEPSSTQARINIQRRAGESSLINRILGNAVPDSYELEPDLKMASAHSESGALMWANALTETLLTMPFTCIENPRPGEPGIQSRTLGFRIEAYT